MIAQRAERANRPDPAMIRETLRLLFQPGDVAELRILNTPTARTVSGYYDDHDRLAQDAATLQRRYGCSVYLTLNPPKPELLSRANNRAIERAKSTTADSDISRRRWLLVDLDPRRPAGISASDAEHEAARARAADIRDALRAEGWPDPVLADSGNGAHLLYRMALANDPESTALLRGCLEALAVRFGDAAVDVDTTTFNASRITKFYGTLAVKGDSTAERPHRLARLLDVPETLTPVPRELLAALAAHAPAPALMPRSGGSFDLDRWIAHAGLIVAREGEWHGGYRWVLRECPWNPEHTDGSAYIVRFASGAIAAGCHHNGCTGNGWRELRARYEPDGEAGAAAEHERTLAATAPTSTLPADASRPAPPRITRAPALMAAQFPPQRWAVPEILPEGVNILAGPPKKGKSWFALALAVGVAAGGYVLGTVPVAAGDVLYLALEDGERRLQDRLDRLLDGEPAPERLYLATEWRRFDDGGLDDLDAYLREHPETRLIVVDTLKRVRPRERHGASVYGQDYDALAPLTRLGQRYCVAILVVHHTRKAAADDPLDMVNGSNGLNGAADAVLVLRRGSGSVDATLTIAGRDVEERELALRFDPADCSWTLLDRLAEQQSETRRAILRVLEETDAPLTPQEIAERAGLDHNVAKQRAWQMARDGHLVRAGGGRYAPAPSGDYDTPHNRRNRVTEAPLAGVDRSSEPVTDTSARVRAITAERNRADGAELPASGVDHPPLPPSGYAVTAVMDSVQHRDVLSDDAHAAGDQHEPPPSDCPRCGPAGAAGPLCLACLDRYGRRRTADALTEVAAA
ncbi:MAG TPA: AAA family ATPase [Dehalococcoidia bacterium]|nr:AAA family ATPase [Dehalococcoidia bacterium]